jgi:gluconolactonase
MKRLVILVLAACGGDDGGHPAIDASVMDEMFPADAPMFDPLAGVGTVETVQGGYIFTEGPQWREATNDLVFSDIQGNTIYRYTGSGAPVVHKMPSNMSNGLAIDGAGKLVAAEHGSRSVTRDGTQIAAMFETKQLNSPNDVIVAADGTIYFTDPPFGLPNGTPSALGFMGVFRIAPDGTLTAERRGGMGERPNGIGLAPDGKTVYVADSADGKLYKYAVGAGGTLGERQLFATTAGGPDGLAVDIGGNVFVTTSGGVEVFAPSGTRWGKIATPMQPANCAFGDADHRTLYITARTTVYRVKLANAGLPRN